MDFYATERLPQGSSTLLSTEDFITALFYRVDTVAADIPKHPQGRLRPGELMTPAILYALKGRGERAFYPDRQECGPNVVKTSHQNRPRRFPNAVFVRELRKSG